MKYGCNRSRDQRGSRHTSAGLHAQQQALAPWDRACLALGAVRRGLGSRAGTEGLQAHCSAGECPGSIPVLELLAAPSVVSLPERGECPADQLAIPMSWGTKSWQKKGDFET